MFDLRYLAIAPAIAAIVYFIKATKASVMLVKDHNEHTQLELQFDIDVRCLLNAGVLIIVAAMIARFLDFYVVLYSERL